MTPSFQTSHTQEARYAELSGLESWSFSNFVQGLLLGAKNGRPPALPESIDFGVVAPTINQMEALSERANREKAITYYWNYDKRKLFRDISDVGGKIEVGMKVISSKNLAALFYAHTHLKQFEDGFHLSPADLAVLFEDGPFRFQSAWMRWRQLTLVAVRRWDTVDVSGSPQRHIENLFHHYANQLPFDNHYQELNDKNIQIEITRRVCDDLKLELYFSNPGQHKLRHLVAGKRISFR
jgi:hypothetical protein